MYTIEICNKGSDPLVIFNDMVPIKDMALINPRLELESGTAGTLDFGFVDTNVGYNDIFLMTTELVVRRFNKEVWRGRVLNIDTDFYKQKDVEVEGEMAYLNDTYQPQIEYDGMTLRQYVEGIISVHNQKVDNDAEPFDKTFEVGAIMPDGEIVDDEAYRNTSYECTYQILKTIADKYDAYWYLTFKEENGKRKRYLNLIKEPTHSSGQIITFGQNLLDYDQKFKMENLATVCLPVGARIDDDMAGDEIVCDSIFKKADGSSFLYTCLGSDGIPYAIDDSGTTGDGQYYRALKIVKLSDFGIKPKDKVFFTSVVESDIAGVPGKEDVWRDGIYSFLSFAGYDGNGFPTWSKGDGWPSSSVQHSDITTFSYNEKQGLTVPDGPEDNIYLFVGGTARPADTKYKLQVFKQKLTSERLDEYFTLVNYPDVTPESENYKGVSHKKGELYLINDELYKRYGWVEKKIEYSDLEATEELFKMSEKWMTETQFTQMTLELTAYDLSILNVDLEQIWVNTLVGIFSAPHGITDLTLPCSKMTIRFNDPDSTEYTLGYSTDKTISNASSSNANAITDVIKEQPKISAVLKSSKENAASILDLFANDGVVTFVKDETNPNIIRAIHILNSETPEHATGRWVYNYGGWGYQKRNDDGSWPKDVEIAGTSDGSLVANKITTGNMFADRIAGGTLKLGHVLVEDKTTGETEYLDGDLAVYDSNNTPMLKVNPEGVITASEQMFVQDYNGRIFGSAVPYEIIDGKLINKFNGKEYQSIPYDVESYNRSYTNEPVGHGGQNIPVLGIIDFQNRYDIDGGLYGMTFATKILGLKSDYIYVNDRRGRAGLTVTEDVSVVDGIDGEGNPNYKRLHFVNGLYMGWD